MRRVGIAIALLVALVSLVPVAALLYALGNFVVTGQLAESWTVPRLVTGTAWAAVVFLLARRIEIK